MRSYDCGECGEDCTLVKKVMVMSSGCVSVFDDWLLGGQDIWRR